MFHKGSDSDDNNWTCQWQDSYVFGLRDDLARARAILVNTCNAIGNGSGCVESVSLDFLDGVPGEVSAEIAKLRADLATANGKLRSVRAIVFDSGTANESHVLTLCKIADVVKG